MATGQIYVWYSYDPEASISTVRRAEAKRALLAWVLGEYGIELEDISNPEFQLEAKVPHNKADEVLRALARAGLARKVEIHVDAVELSPLGERLTRELETLGFAFFDFIAND